MVIDCFGDSDARREAGHWSTQLATINADDVANFKAGEW
jgi:hypothetical protein